MGLQGSAHLTKDIDFCYERSPANIERLAAALRRTILHFAAHRRVCPFRFDRETISKGLDFTLKADLGDIDFLGEVSGLGAFDKVKRRPT